MRRWAWSLAAIVALLLAGTMTGRGAVPAGAVGSAKKTCKTVYKKVHGKKTKVTVCTTRTPTALPLPTMVTDGGCGCGSCSAAQLATLEHRRRGIRVLGRAGVKLAGSTPVTPDSRSIQLFVPYAWSGNDFPAIDYEPAIQSLQSEGYQLAGSYIQSTLTAGTQATSISRFLQSGSAGVLIIYGHGSEGGLPLETYPHTPAGKAAEQKAYRGYVRKYEGSTPPNASKYFAETGYSESDPKDPYAFGITPEGVAKLWHGHHTLVILAACEGTNLANAFIQAGAQVVFYWPHWNVSSATWGQLHELFGRLDGTKYRDAGLDSDKIRTTDNAFQDCSECTAGTDHPMAVLAQGPMTLAPAVKSRSPEPGSTVLQGASFDVNVAFDTEMNRSKDASSVLTMQGCGTSGPLHDGPDVVKPLQWNGNSISGTFRATQTGTLTLTVHGDQAVSANNGSQLDGNQHGTNDTPVAPNQGNDFVWKVNCGLTGYKAGPVTLTWTDGKSQITDTWTFDICRQLTFSGQPYWNEYLHERYVTNGQVSETNGQEGGVPYPGGGTTTTQIGTRTVTFNMAAKTVSVTATILSDWTRAGYGPASQTATGPIQPWPNCTAG